MNSKPVQVLVFTCLLLALGCHRAPPPQRYIALLDISKSIYPEAVDQEFDVMTKFVAQLRRGDELVIIPITGNSRTDAPGHIVRLFSPTARATFDSDLSAFRKDAEGQVASLKDWARKNRATHTDIFGALQVAQEETAATNKGRDTLIIFSDFLEDDGEVRFASDRRLASKCAAQRYAQAVSPALVHVLRPNAIYAVRLQSKDSLSLKRIGWDAIDAFWTDVLGADRKRPLFTNGSNELLRALSLRQSGAVEP